MPPRELPTLLLPARHLQALQALLRQHVPEAEVWAYGSRVTGGAHEGSDLDLVLRRSSDLTQPVAGCLALREALQDSPLPMLVEVHQWADVPAGFRANMAAAHVVLQPATRALAASAPVENQR